MLKYWQPLEKVMHPLVRPWTLDPSYATADTAPILKPTYDQKPETFLALASLQKLPGGESLPITEKEKKR